jgi:hypothetical protein
METSSRLSPRHLKEETSRNSSVQSLLEEALPLLLLKSLLRRRLKSPRKPLSLLPHLLRKKKIWTWVTCSADLDPIFK